MLTTNGLVMTLVKILSFRSFQFGDEVIPAKFPFNKVKLKNTDVIIIYVLEDWIIFVVHSNTYGESDFAILVPRNDSEVDAFRRHKSVIESVVNETFFDDKYVLIYSGEISTDPPSKKFVVVPNGIARMVSSGDIFFYPKPSFLMYSKYDLSRLIPGYGTVKVWQWKEYDDTGWLYAKSDNMISVISVGIQFLKGGENDQNV